jgi:uncharacterized membrane protein YphA (DoxX/SURF4 family)
MTRGRVLVGLRILAGGVFVVFGVGKFVNHAAELASFKSYGLPLPGLFVIAVGAIELVGGVLLISGRSLRPTASVLAGDMLGAIAVSGVAKREIISLTLAPALLIAMIALLCAERRPSVLGERPGLR